ncbi:hypothetical protein CAPTEDRAFT_93388 [Capitella teleta]|uniref:Protein-tyrosine-phosphatase n=1 Tax=Capitella teleta TaxID=283909 RepID=R7TE97_CAPTE|nr:hypothetical protein CAPTEDRAFT_93388 [Capitella teleta]|eukprot:ELT89386.1 hypothetical protein CAPTEDRAFT_93388 [Capitella teleta]
MSFLAEIQGFKRSHLKSSDTSVTLESGEKFLETHDKYGHSKRTKVSEGEEFMCIGDGKLDLQIGEVLPSLLVSSQDVAADFDLLREKCVTHILNVACRVENFFPDDFTYKRLNILDLPETNIVDYFPECFEFIEEGMQQGRVLVHCNAGVSRSASIVIGYLMQREGKKFQSAYDLVKSQRPATRPNDGFMQQLKAYASKGPS